MPLTNYPEITVRGIKYIFGYEALNILVIK